MAGNLFNEAALETGIQAKLEWRGEEGTIFKHLRRPRVFAYTPQVAMGPFFICYRKGGMSNCAGGR